MKKILILFAGLLFFAVSCDTTDEVCDQCDGWNSEEVTIWVDAELYTCPDDPAQKCYYAQISDTLNEDAWEPWTQEICGFDFQPAYRYKLSVKRKKDSTDDNGNVYYKYCLIRIEQKTFVSL